MLRKMRHRGGPYDLNNLVRLGEQTPAKEWVYSLLDYMLKNHIGHFVLVRSQGIPSIPLRDELPEAELDFDKIINRIKVMARLDPGAYKEPRKGEFPVSVGGRQYTITASFIETDSDSTCEITLSEDEARPPAS
jgi:hypothetical protein